MFVYIIAEKEPVPIFLSPPTLSSLAANVINAIHTGDTTNMTIIISAIDAYAEAYTIQKELSHIALIQEMCRIYWEYERVLRLNEIHMTPCEHALSQTQRAMRQSALLKTLRSVDDLAIFENFPPPDIFDAESITHIRNIIKVAYESRGLSFI